MKKVENLVKAINLEATYEKISNVKSRVNEGEKKFYFLENKVKLMQEMLAHKIRKLQIE